MKAAWRSRCSTWVATGAAAQAEPLHGLGLDLGVEVDHGAHRAGDLAHGHLVDGRVESLPGPGAGRTQ